MEQMAIVEGLCYRAIGNGITNAFWLFGAPALPDRSKFFVA